MQDADGCLWCAQLVQTYTRGMLPGLWPYIWSCVIMKVSSHIECSSKHLKSSTFGRPLLLYCDQITCICSVHAQSLITPCRYGQHRTGDVVGPMKEKQPVCGCACAGAAGAEPDVGTRSCDCVHVLCKHRLQCAAGLNHSDSLGRPMRSQPPASPSSCCWQVELSPAPVYVCHPWLQSGRLGAVLKGATIFHCELEPSCL